MQEFNLDFARVIEDSCRCAKYKGRGGILFFNHTSVVYI